jgi:NAD(P)-dependent dehydrogenase (short-subunit alcohol dehydrogenase family)
VVARAFADGGARLALAGTDRDKLVTLANDLGLGDERWVAAIGDLRSGDGARDAVHAVEQRFGRVDVLLHLVGGQAPGGPVVELAHEALRSMLEQHLWTTLNVIQAVVPGMVDRGWGRIGAVTSPTATAPSPGRATYAITKVAEETLVRTLAREVGGTGVTANLVAVRTIDVDHERERERTPKNAPWTTPEEIAAVFLFLASDEAASVNGATIPLFNRT